MTKAEILTTVLSSLAILFSVYTWTQQRRLQREANDLQRATDELAKKQLAMLKREELQRLTVNLSLTLFREPGLERNYSFVLSNIGQADAYDVTFDVPGEGSPIVESDHQAQLPRKQLHPGESLRVKAAIYPETPSMFMATLAWTNPDGSPGRDMVQLTL